MDPNIFQLTYSTWIAGGIMMMPLAVLTFFVYYNLLSLHIDIRSRIGKKVGKLLRKEMLGQSHTLEELHEHFQDKEHEELPGFRHRLSMSAKMTSALPLMGLLGTVLGMIYLFSMMGTSNADMMKSLAGGISKALYPPLIGIAASLPSMLIMSFIKENITKYDTFFMRMERKAIRKFIKEHPEENANLGTRPLR